MARYTFTSPLADAGKAMQEYILQRKEEERQKMLDAMAQKEMESQSAAREMQIRADQERLANLLQERELQTLNLSLAGEQPGADLRSKPEDIQGLAKKYGLSGQQYAPSTVSDGSEFIGPQDPNAQFYRGAPEDIARNRRIESAGRFLQTLPKDDPQRERLAKYVRMMQAMESDELPKEAFAEDRPMFVYDPNTGKTIPLRGPDGKPITTTAQNTVDVLPFRPREAKDHGTIIGPATDMNGKVIPGKVLSMRNGVIEVVDLPEGIGGFGPKPSTKVSTFMIPSAMLKQGQDLRAKATPIERWGWIPDTEPATEDVEAYKQWQSGIINNYVTKNYISEDAANLLREVITDDRLKKYSAHDIGQSALRKGQLTEDEMPQFVEVLSTVRGENNVPE